MSRKVVYRIIKFEGTEEAVNHQLMSSIMDNIVSEPSKDLTISIKDRNDDPNERGFFDSCRQVKGMATRAQALAFDEKEILKDVENGTKTD